VSYLTDSKTIISFIIFVFLQEKDRRPEAGPFLDSDTITRNKKSAEKSRNLFRYTNKASEVLSRHIGGNLSEGDYPWVRPPKKGMTTTSTAGTESAAGPGLAAALGGHGEAGNTCRRL
jgi:hypothetical protein